MPHDLPTLDALYRQVIAEFGDTAFVRAVVTKDGTILVPQQGEPVVLPAFCCRNGDAMTAHFTACILNHAGLGEFRALRTLLGTCDQLLTVRIGTEVAISVQLRCK